VFLGGGEYMNKASIIAIVLVIVAAAAGFFGGMQYQKNQAVTMMGQSGQYRRFGQFGQNQNMRPVRGQILSIDGNTVTVKMPDGSSKIVVVSGTTAFMKSTSGALTDLKSGDTIVVIGSSNSDGSVTAQAVQINPPMQMRGPKPSGTPTGQ